MEIQDPKDFKDLVAEALRNPEIPQISESSTNRNIKESRESRNSKDLYKLATQTHQPSVYVRELWNPRVRFVHPRHFPFDDEAMPDFEPRMCIPALPICIAQDNYGNSGGARHIGLPSSGHGHHPRDDTMFFFTLQGRTPHAPKKKRFLQLFQRF